MEEKNFAFEQVEPKYPHVVEELDEMRAESNRWRIVWEDGTERETTWAIFAWIAREFDTSATVTPL